jgi:acetyltransferase-like isoleucine patch superfamily enzyme
MRFLSTIFKNPFTQWCKWVTFALRQQFSHRKQHLLIRYGAQFSKVQFGYFNTLYERAFLTDVVIGDYSYIGRDNVVACADIGKFTCLAPEVIVGMPNHPSRDFISAHPAFYSTARQAQITFVDKDYFSEFKRVTIGHDVWIGTRSIIMGGVSIGNGAIIGAGAVVTKDVPPYAVVAGVPAKVVRYRFDAEEIEKLEEIKWWDRDISWLRQNADLFHQVDEFLSSESKSDR